MSSNCGPHHNFVFVWFWTDTEKLSFRSGRWLSRWQFSWKVCVVRCTLEEVFLKYWIRTDSKVLPGLTLKFFFYDQLSTTRGYTLDCKELSKTSFKVMRRGTKTRSDSDSPDLTNMNHSNDASEPLTTSMLDEGATSPLSASHSKSGKHEGDSKKERVVKVALPGAKKAQSAAKKKKSTPDLVSWLFYVFTVRQLTFAFF